MPAASALARLHDWWASERCTLVPCYEARLYPAFLDLERLQSDDPDERRLAWFTLFALSCFETIGRTRDRQHRSFLERTEANGSWRALAASRPPRDVQAWLDTLTAMSGPDAATQSFMPWKRTFVDLYAVARHLDAYVELLEALPGFAEHKVRISLSSVFAPATSELAQRLGLDAAPLGRSIGVGANWMVRELVRKRIVDGRELSPHCFAPRLRVRRLLERMGMQGLSSEANPEDSPHIHAFVVAAIGEERARFLGDHDLPFQLLPEHPDARAWVLASSGADDHFDPSDNMVGEDSGDEADALDA